MQRKDAVGQLLLRFRRCLAVELGETAVGRSGRKPQDVKEILVGNILSGAVRPNAGLSRGTSLVVKAFSTIPASFIPHALYRPFELQRLVVFLLRRSPPL